MHAKNPKLIPCLHEWLISGFKKNTAIFLYGRTPATQSQKRVTNVQQCCVPVILSMIGHLKQKALLCVFFRRFEAIWTILLRN
jgi:hypothetical protein